MLASKFSPGNSISFLHNACVCGYGGVGACKGVSVCVPA